MKKKLPQKVEDFLRELFEGEFSIHSDEAYIFMDTLVRGEVILNKKEIQKRYEDLIK